jgi:hypothetical protein
MGLLLLSVVGSIMSLSRSRRWGIAQATPAMQMVWSIFANTAEFHATANVLTLVEWTDNFSQTS